MADVNVIGSLEAKFESTNRIYDVGGCSPTLSTMQGGNQEPKILEEQIPCKLNKMPEGHLDSLDNAKICDVDTPTASTITSRYYKGIGAHKDNMCIVAMRGRNPDNPSDRTAGSPTEQRLKVNMQGTSNCLTSVQKDNLLLENVKIRQATKDGSIECDIGGCFDASYPNSKTRRGRVQDKGNICPTLTAQNQEVVRIEKPLLLGGVGKENEFGKQYRQGNRVYSSDACAMALSSQPVGNAGGNSYLYNVGYRIRKLTPRECGRLMGVSDEDIDKMAAVNSNTQLYKQFGNSIVVDVMCAMFKNLNIKQGDSNETLQTN